MPELTTNSAYNYHQIKLVAAFVIEVKFPTLTETHYIRSLRFGPEKLLSNSNEIINQWNDVMFTTDIDEALITSVMDDPADAVKFTAIQNKLISMLACENNVGIINENIIVQYGFLIREANFKLVPYSITKNPGSINVHQFKESSKRLNRIDFY